MRWCLGVISQREIRARLAQYELVPHGSGMIMDQSGCKRRKWRMVSKQGGDCVPGSRRLSAGAPFVGCSEESHAGRYCPPRDPRSTPVRIGRSLDREINATCLRKINAGDMRNRRLASPPFLPGFTSRHQRMHGHRRELDATDEDSGLRGVAGNEWVRK